MNHSRLAGFLGFVVQCLYALALGAVLGLAFFSVPLGLPPPAGLLVTVAAVLAYFLAISWATTLVHELGHALAFSLLDFRLLAIKIGPFLFKRAPHAPGIGNGSPAG